MAIGARNVRRTSLVSKADRLSPVERANVGAPSESPTSGARSINWGGWTRPLPSPLKLNVHGPNPLPPLSPACQPSVYAEFEALSEATVIAFATLINVA